MSHLFHISPVAPPSHHVRPVASVPSLRAAAVVVLRLDGGAGGQQHLDHLQVAFMSRQEQRFVASVRRTPLEMATGRAKSHELLRRISEDFGSEKLGVWLPTESHTGIGNMSQISQPKNSLNWIGKSQLRTYNNLLNLQAYPFSGVRHLRRLAPGSGGPPAASVGQLRRCLLSQPAGCLRLKAETLDVWRPRFILNSGSVIMS